MESGRDDQTDCAYEFAHAEGRPDLRGNAPKDGTPVLTMSNRTTFTMRDAP